jgi:hypothetical protein
MIGALSRLRYIRLRHPFAIAVLFIPLSKPQIPALFVKCGFHHFEYKRPPRSLGHEKDFIADEELLFFLTGESVNVDGYPTKRVALLGHVLSLDEMRAQEAQEAAQAVRVSAWIKIL